MNIKANTIYGIGNPLLDILVDNIDDLDLEKLSINKGIMHLIDKKERDFLLKYIKDKNISYFCGGSAPNTIISLGSLGINSTLGGKVGKDKEGLIYKENLKKLNINDSLSFSKNKTGSTIILISEDGERTMNTYLGANRDFSKKDLNIEAIKKSGIFHFTGYMFDTENQKEALLYALALCKEYDTRISFDIADSFVVGRNKKTFLNIIENYVDILFANSDEARMLVNHYEPRECCKSLYKICKLTIVKNGKHGSFIGYNDKILSIPIQGAKSPIDSTGAGDMFASGFLYGLLKNKDIETSAYIASLLAGEIISQVGAQFSREKAMRLKKKIESL